jgi:hypothetical protein
LAGIVVDGNKNVTPGDGAMIHVDTSTITDNNTSGSGTAAKYTHVSFEAPTLAATNVSVTTSDAATVYINNAATAGTNQTITRNWALWVDVGNARFDGSIYSGTTEAMDSSGLVTVANQSNITGVSTITSGTWEGTTVAVDQGGTGATTLNDLITLETHTTGDYVQNITAGTGLTSTGATSGENIAHSLSVDASQTQITAVGTVTTGTWSTGAVIAGATMTVGSDATGDVYYRNASGVLTRLAAGSDADVLTLASGIPSWATPTVGDITGVDLTGGTNINISSETNTTGGDYSSTINLDTSPTLTSSSVSTPVLTLTNTHADATAGYLKFVKDPGSGEGADDDVMGTITFHGTDASNNGPEELARMEAYVIEADHGSEAGGMKFYVAENDATMTAGLQILGQATDDGEIDVTIGAGAASTTTIAGTLTMGSTAAMTNAGLVAVANQSAITGVSTITSGTWEATDVAVLHGGTGASSASAARTNLGLGTAAVAATGISNTNVLVANATIVDDDFLRVDGTSIEGRSASEVASDIGASTVGLSVAMAIAL